MPSAKKSGITALLAFQSTKAPVFIYIYAFFWSEHNSKKSRKHPLYMKTFGRWKIGHQSPVPRKQRRRLPLDTLREKTHFAAPESVLTQELTGSGTVTLPTY